MKAKWNISWFDGVSIHEWESEQQPHINQVSGIVSFNNLETNRIVYLSGSWSIEEL